MGLPGLCYLGGIKETFWTALGLCVGTYLAWLLIAKPLRKCSVAFGDSITVPEFLSNRFKDRTRILSVISGLFIVLFLLSIRRLDLLRAQNFLIPYLDFRTMQGLQSVLL